MAASIVCFVGRSNSGKTTLIERLIPVLIGAGYRVATVKHAGHGFELDTEGKDSWRHKRAGASAVVVLSKGSMAMFADVAEEMKVVAGPRGVQGPRQGDHPGPGEQGEQRLERRRRPRMVDGRRTPIRVRLALRKPVGPVPVRAPLHARRVQADA